MKLMTCYTPLIDLALTKICACQVYDISNAFCVHTFLYVERSKLKQVKL
jgi:hypothetical protein